MNSYDACIRYSGMHIFFGIIRFMVSGLQQFVWKSGFMVLRMQCFVWFRECSVLFGISVGHVSLMGHVCYSMY